MKAKIKEVLDAFFDVDDQENHVIIVNESDTELLAQAIEEVLSK